MNIVWNIIYIFSENVKNNMANFYYYILDKDWKTPIGTNDVSVWSRWFEGANVDKKDGCTKRHVVRELFHNKTISISTVFLGLDHNYSFKGSPILWETMIFGCGRYEDYQERYCSYDNAVIGHKRACELIKEYVDSLAIGRRKI